MVSEKDLQIKTIASLKEAGYEYAGSHWTENKLQDNFLNKFLNFNKHKLPETLSPSEKTRLLQQLPLRFREAYSALRHGITLTLDTGEQTTLTFLDHLNPQNNSYQIIEEAHIQGITGTRLDLVLLINGVPIVNIELKKPGASHGVDEALNQINRYASNGDYMNNLYVFTQLFVISNDIITKYFSASPRSETKEKYTKTFTWTDEQNKPIHQITKFVETFLNPEQLVKIITKYMLLTPQNLTNETYVLRPYQLYAVENAVERLTETNGNGFIWHATGSGKTLTSYMLASTVSQKTKFGKVIMLLDRNDLADQTITEYQTFNPEFVKTSVKGNTLHKHLTDPTVKFVMTTTQSFNKWIERHTKTSQALARTNMCFVVDECHRTTFGEMFHTIRKTFPRSQFIGFTGTPRLAENPAITNLLTKDIFGEPIHIYTTKNAINDNNVLPFKINEIEIIASTTPDKKNKQYYTDPARLQQISTHITENLWKNTNQQTFIKNRELVTDGYTAMLATQGKETAYNYWKLLTPQLAEQNRTTALVYSITDNTEDHGNGTEIQWYLENLINHDKNFGTNFAETWKKDRATARTSHLRDVTTRVKNREIDLLIVSDMLLTGFDAKTLNTIYLDKNLDYHSLLQAMSRTNRTYRDQKMFGRIVIYSDRQMNEDIDNAILLFSNGENVDGVIERKTYTQTYNETIKAINEFKHATPNPEQLHQVDNSQQYLQILKKYSKTQTLIRELQTYDEWEQTDWKKLGITADTLDIYKAHLYEVGKKFLNTDDLPVEVSEEIAFVMGALTTHTIDVAYINALLDQAIYAPPRKVDAYVKKVYNAVSQSTDPQVQANAEAILNTAEAIRTGEIKNHAQRKDRLEKELEETENARIITYADDYKIPVEEFRNWVILHKINNQPPASLIGAELRKQKLGFLKTSATQKEIIKLIEQKFPV